MKDLNSLEINVLVDMLAIHTNEYLKMLKEGATDDEYSKCKKMIEDLTAEIDQRHKNKLHSPKIGINKGNAQ